MELIALCVLFIIREIFNALHSHKQDKLISELTDKIKAKDFTEYVEQTKPPPQFEPVHNDDEELYMKEIESMKG